MSRGMLKVIVLVAIAYFAYVHFVRKVPIKNG